MNQSQLIAELVLDHLGENRSKSRSIEAIGKFQTLSILVLITAFLTPRHGNS